MFLARSREFEAVEGRRRLAMAFSFLAIAAFATPAHAAANGAYSPEITGSLTPAEPAYEQREFTARPGLEAIELAARLRENGGLVTLPVSWRIYRLIGGITGGEEVFRADAPQAEAAVPPGDYRIDIDYGLAQFSRLVTLDSQRRLSLIFNLNTGGIRVLSRVTIEPPTAGFATAHRLFALSGRNRARLVAKNAKPGELLRLPAGTYRVESELTPGNAVAHAEVDVKPGMLSAVEIDHQAGVVRLGLAKPLHHGFTWQVIDARGRIAAEAAATSLNVVLTPGRYQARATSGEVTFSSEFTVAAGRSLNIILGP
jgi:hypothetical protein